MTTDRSHLRTLLPRHAEAELTDALLDTRVVAITGPRQAGKSTLALKVLGSRADTVVANLDDETTLRAAKFDPAGFVDRQGPLIVDEIQRAPELYLAIKASVDRDQRPGRFLVTGSAHMHSALADALVGRMELIELWPFSQAEIERRKPTLIDEVFAGRIPMYPSSLTRSHYVSRAVAGGYPEPLLRLREARRARWYADHISSLAEREIRRLAAIEHTEAIPALLRLLAARTGTLSNVDALAKELRLPSNTVRRYVGLLWSAYIVRSIPAWSNNRTKRVTRAPKVFIADTGLACSLLGLDATGLSDPVAPAGPIIETFCVMEVLKQVTNRVPPISIHHLRTHDGVEVDIVLEAAAGKVVGIEIKSGATVRQTDFAGLRYLAARTGDRFCAGIVLYTGPEALPFGPGLAALPISALWTGEDDRGG